MPKGTQKTCGVAWKNAAKRPRESSINCAEEEEELRSAWMMSKEDRGRSSTPPTTSSKSERSSKNNTDHLWEPSSEFTLYECRLTRAKVLGIYIEAAALHRTLFRCILQGNKGWALSCNILKPCCCVWLNIYIAFNNAYFAMLFFIHCENCWKMNKRKIFEMS